MRLTLALLAFAASCLAADHGATVSPDRALELLKEGNERYVASRLQHPDQSAERRHLVAQGQHPFAVILGCADSRVPPEVVFDQGLGDLFVVRVAGNVTSPEVLGSIEYAVEHLGAPLVMVLGHEKCGAIQATAAGGKADGHIAVLVHDLAPALKQARKQKGDLVHNAVVCNVRNAVHAIETATPLLKKMVASHHLVVIGADYDLETGKVEMLKASEAVAKR